MIPEAEPLHRRDHADGHADEDGEAERARRQQERGGQPLEHHLEGRPLRPDRRAEIAVQGVAEEARVLKHQRRVEAQRALKRLHLLGRGVLAEHHTRRIAGRQVEQREHHHRHQPDEQQRLGAPPHDVAKHLGPHLPLE